LIPEEWCPKTRRSLGNHPQAYSHVGLINAALAIANAEPPAP
jgi:GH15 family glucan-1,4-alpha-glucosidase